MLPRCPPAGTWNSTPAASAFARRSNAAGLIWPSVARVPASLVVEHFDVVEQLHLRVSVNESNRLASSLFTVEKKLSMTALSWQLPRRLMLQTIPRASRSAW